MKVAVLSESAADEAAIRILVDAVLMQQTEPVGPPPLRSRGWPAVLSVLPGVIRHLQYQTDADGLVVVKERRWSGYHRCRQEPLHRVRKCA